VTFLGLLFPPPNVKISLAMQLRTFTRFHWIIHDHVIHELYCHKNILVVSTNGAGGRQNKQCCQQVDVNFPNEDNRNSLFDIKIPAIVDEVCYDAFGDVGGFNFSKDQFPQLGTIKLHL
jgi:hypothetical protein